MLAFDCEVSESIVMGVNEIVDPISEPAGVMHSAGISSHSSTTVAFEIATGTSFARLQRDTVLAGTKAGPVTVRVADGDASISLDLTVSDEEVVVEALDTRVLTGLTLSDFDDSGTAFASSLTFGVTTSVESVLVAEGDTAKVVAYARFDDGTSAHRLCCDVVAQPPCTALLTLHSSGSGPLVPTGPRCRSGPHNSLPQQSH